MMKILKISRKRIVLIMAVALSGLQCVQAANIEHLKELKEQNIYVILYDELEYMIQKIKRKEDESDVEDYRIRVKEFNGLIKSSLKTYWPNPEQLKFINFTDYYELLKGGFEEDFAGVLAVYNSPKVRMQEIQWNDIISVRKIKKLMAPYDWPAKFKKYSIDSVKGMCRFELWHKNAYRSSPLLNMRNGSPNEADFKMAVLQTSSYIESHLDDTAPDLVKGFNQLSSKTLLINELDLIDGMSTPDTMNKLYPYKYKILSGHVIDSIILLHSKDYAVLTLNPYTINVQQTQRSHSSFSSSASASARASSRANDRSASSNVGVIFKYNTVAIDLQDYRVLSQTNKTQKSDRIQALTLLALDPVTFKVKRKELLDKQGTKGITLDHKRIYARILLSSILSVVLLAAVVIAG